MVKQPEIQVPPSQYLPKSSPPKQKSQTRLLILVLILIIVLGGGAAYYFLVYSQENTNQNSNQVISNENVNKVSNANQDLDQRCLSWNVPTNSNTNEPVISPDKPVSPGYYYDQEVSKCEYFPGRTSGSQIAPPFETLEECQQVCENGTAVNTNEALNQNINTNISIYYSFTNDADNDGLSDRVESWYGTDINEADTDSDDYSDYQEIDNCYNPLSTGRMTVLIYRDFCNKDLEHKYSSLSQSMRQSLCSEWSRVAQLAIDAEVSGDGTVNMSSFSAELCNKSEEIVKGTDVIGICNYVVTSVTRLCSGQSLQNLSE